ncbi:methyltransferase, partial [Campylobacter coli]|nr:methyltransferase [Campylobacter coli]
MQNSLEAYTMKYNENGYGLLFPDGHVVRFYQFPSKKTLASISE